ncbi:MAG: phosphatidylserine decarboxylase [Acidobacteria bacterium]|nr:phosphatidylserine decarboxylase [Acidobacteriota bacterium]MCA1636994.1 phosphatidylserine decarboxylase [Acidobacteriota bacterium]
MVKEGFPFVIVPVAIAIIFAFFQIWIGVIVFVALALFMAFFFRDPQRLIPSEADIIVSAADGKVTRIEDRENGKFVSVFLSPVDVHINRAPIAGRVVKVERFQGKKAPATSNQASQTNERNSITIEGEKMTVVCTQIVGILARRIVCWSKEGDYLKTGEKFGLIKFGSRTDLLMPENVELAVKIGDKVVGGETIIGRLIEYNLTPNYLDNSLAELPVVN